MARRPLSDWRPAPQGVVASPTLGRWRKRAVDGSGRGPDKPATTAETTSATGGEHKLQPAKLKALLRRAAARTVDELWAVIGASLDTFTPAECINYFAAAGYDALRSASALGGFEAARHMRIICGEAQTA